MKEFNKQIDRIEKSLHKKTGIKSLEDVLDKEFIRENTVYTTNEDFFADMPEVDFEKHDGINRVDMKALNQFIHDKTEFSNWNEMIQNAYAHFHKSNS